ncbi:hypothetical protein CRG98_050373 [Punica granatum]|uniref:AB hydrolase-1 domain-containing protein n=1 Tax=Punica granatum TaxID=22663 RepID=A0A2I0GCI5_PUNGR|nr:hypothetical protein CRG98_050373 [Punica granatum]
MKDVVNILGLSLRASQTDLGDDTVMHCWASRKRDPGRPDLILIHGIGPDARWQLGRFLPPLMRRNNVYALPGILRGLIHHPAWAVGGIPGQICGGAHGRPQCLQYNQFTHFSDRMILVGLRYGGFVAYSLAAQFPERVERVVICIAG